MSTAQRTRIPRRIICTTVDLVATRRRIRAAGGRVVMSSPVGRDSYAIDYVTGM